MGWLCREPVHLPPITIVPSFIDLTSFDLKLSGDGAAKLWQEVPCSNGAGRAGQE